MAKTSKKAQQKVHAVMEEFKHGDLKSGPGGKGGKVKNPRQAIAIALNEAREAGYKTPAKPKNAAKKAAPKKAVKTAKKVAKKASAKKVVSKSK